MAEFDNHKIEYKTNFHGQEHIIYDLKYYNRLNIEGFSQMLKDPSYCYKFYWLEAIVKLISEGVTEATFEDIIDEMICNAWYSVREFQIHLSGLQADGKVRDGLERAIVSLADLSHLDSSSSKVQIKNALREYVNNDDLRQAKKQLTNMVPYRALAGFFPQKPTEAEWNSARRMTAFIQRINDERVLLPYTLGESANLNKEIYFHPEWIKMIQDNTVSILGWIQNEKLKWLQHYNPEVPRLVYKLAPMDEKMRKLNHVRKLWNGILELSTVIDVFTGEPIVPKKYDVDHFIPWSFVMNDELWNLMPMDSSLNSSKSNKLPEWEPFFPKFAENQYLMYDFVHKKPGIRKLFDACYEDNLQSLWAGQDLYGKEHSKAEFCEILHKNMKPVYDSARRQGYEAWKMG